MVFTIEGFFEVAIESIVIYIYIYIYIYILVGSETKSIIVFRLAILLQMGSVHPIA